MRCQPRGARTCSRGSWLGSRRSAASNPDLQCHRGTEPNVRHDSNVLYRRMLDHLKGRLNDLTIKPHCSGEHSLYRRIILTTAVLDLPLLDSDNDEGTVVLPP